MEQLPPLPFAVGVNQQFCNHPTVALRMRAGLFTHPESYTVTDGYNNPVISCALQATKSGTVGGMTYNVYSMTQRKEIRDGHGNLLFILANEYMHLHQTFVGKHPQTDENIFQIQKAAFSFHGEKKCKFTNVATGQEVELVIRGSFLQRNAEVRLGKDGPMVARVAGHFSTIEVGGFTINLGPHEYSLIVAPGADMALVAALAITIDEMDRPNQQQVP